MTPQFSFTWINWKSVGYYFLTAIAVWVLANITWLEEMLSDFIEPWTLAIVMTIITIILKKFIEKK